MESTRDSRHVSSRPTHVRNSSHISAAEAASAGIPLSTTQTSGSAKPPHDVVAPGTSGSAKRRTTIVAQTGEWVLGKTIGAGSMGKVKLAKNLETGEQVCFNNTSPKLCGLISGFFA